MENWKTFLEQEERKVNIYFSGKCRRCDPDKVREDYDFSRWEDLNSELIIKSYTDTSTYKGPLNKIIGFSAGAKAAIKLKKSHPEATLVLIDPWLPRGYKLSSDVEYYGTSCFISRGANKDRLQGSRKECKPEETSFQSHMKYFKDYFNLGGDQVSTG
tara:strand:+ start:187 stop:660 length:474 start_codon:yes stop_codon:yes gene_type:complete